MGPEWFFVRDPAWHPVLWSMWTGFALLALFVVLELATRDR